MKWLIRGLMLALFLAALARLAQHPPPPAAPAQVRLAAMLGGSLDGPIQAEQSAHGFETITVPLRGCAKPVLIVPMPSHFVSDARAYGFAPGDRIHYAYLDWIGDKPDRLAILIRLIREPMLETLGLSRHGALQTMLVIAEPPSCQVERTQDWSRFWDGREALGLGAYGG